MTVYAKDANGDVAPIRTITGANTELDGPNGIALDSDDNVYVSDYFDNSVTEYAKNANSNVAPIRTISGSTRVDRPGGWQFINPLYAAHGFAVARPCCFAVRFCRRLTVCGRRHITG